MPKQLGLAVIGCGYWGINYVRVFDQFPETNLIAVCDQAADRIKEVEKRYPGFKYFTKIDDVLQMEGIDAVVIATYPSNHYDVAKRFIEAGKHVMIEKPMTKKANDAQELVNLARAKGVVLMAAHIFLYNHGIKKVKTYIDQGDVGRIYYLYSRRTNLGPVRTDVNALWDLAPHDIYIFNYLMNSSPEWVSAVGTRFLRKATEDAGFIILGYPKGVIAQIHVSWADPVKERELVVVGSNQRIVFNDMSLVEKVRVYEKGIFPSPIEPSNYGEFQLSIRDGNIVSPPLPVGEPLKYQVDHFLECIREGKNPISDGVNGMKVVQVMEAVDISMRNNGGPVEVITDY